MNVPPDMSTAPSERAIADLIRRYAPHAEADIASGTRLREELGFESLSLIELAFALELEFSLPPVSDEAAMDVKTVGDIVRLVEQAAPMGRAAT